MFNESYYIFSVGNVKPIWREQYPSCWKVRPGKQCVKASPLLWRDWLSLSVLPQTPVHVGVRHRHRQLRHAQTLSC